MIKVFTPEELLSHNGEADSSILIAFENRVYDLSKSYHWRGGKHHSLHRAGQDLTAFMKTAPHGVDLLEPFPVVGVYKER